MRTEDLYRTLPFQQKRRFRKDRLTREQRRAEPFPFLNCPFMMLQSGSYQSAPTTAHGFTEERPAVPANFQVAMPTCHY